jgi:hypothetical protein
MFTYHLWCAWYVRITPSKNSKKWHSPNKQSKNSFSHTKKIQKKIPDLRKQGAVFNSNGQELSSSSAHFVCMLAVVLVFVCLFVYLYRALLRGGSLCVEASLYVSLYVCLYVSLYVSLCVFVLNPKPIQVLNPTPWTLNPEPQTHTGRWFWRWHQASSSTPLDEPSRN